MKNQLYILGFLIIAFAGCQDAGNELEKSVFIDDSENPGLPVYSEWGYNTFGAYYDREIFISNDYLVPAKVVVSNDTMSFVLNGQIGDEVFDDSTNRYKYKKMSIAFKISGFTPEKYADLLVLNDSTFDLTNPSNKVFILIDSTENNVSIISGELKFKRAQNLFVDKKQVEVILSGYFNFKAVINNVPYSITDGRFDVGVGVNNFFNLN